MIILILLLSALFRFYRFPELFHWTMDEDYWSYLPYNIATGYHFPAIGGHIAGTGLYAGPLFIYLMALPAKIFFGNPLGFGYLVAGLGVLNTFLIYHVAQKLFSHRAAIFSAFFYASSFLMAIFDRHYWNASLTPIFTTLTIWFLFEVKQKKYLFCFPLAFTLALAFHAHGTGMALLLFTIVTWLVFRLPINRLVFLGIVLFFVLQLPLIFFDLRHDYKNTRALISYGVIGDQRLTIGERVGNIVSGFSQASARLIYFPAKDLALEQTLGLPEQYARLRGTAPIFISPLLLVFIVFTLSRWKNNLGVKFCSLLIISTLVGLLIYKDKIPEYFFNPTFVGIFLLLGYFLGEIWQNRIVRFALVLSIISFFYFNFQNLLTVKHSFSYQTRLEAVKKVITAVGNKPFSLDAQCSGFCQLYGFRYLFTSLGHEPISSYVDPNFLWLYQDRLLKVAPEKRVTLIMNSQEVQVYVSNYR